MVIPNLINKLYHTTSPKINRIGFIEAENKEDKIKHYCIDGLKCIVRGAVIGGLAAAIISKGDPKTIIEIASLTATLDVVQSHIRRGFLKELKEYDLQGYQRHVEKNYGINIR